jgi:hypothetical protein
MLAAELGEHPAQLGAEPVTLPEQRDERTGNEGESGGEEEREHPWLPSMGAYRSHERKS